MTAPRPSAGRRTRWVLIGLFATPLVIGAATYAIDSQGPAEPSVAVTVPAGYRAITDAYYGYVVPAGWAEDDSATTANGTFFYAGRTGWAGEVLQAADRAPAADAPGPAALGVFGLQSAAAFSLTDTVPVSVAGATVAYRSTLVRSGAAVGEVVDAWSSATRTEVWLAVHGDPATTATVLGSLRA